jgi:hypothetical protein
MEPLLPCSALPTVNDKSVYRSEFSLVFAIPLSIILEKLCPDTKVFPVYIQYSIAALSAAEGNMVNVLEFVSATRGKTILLSMQLFRDTHRGIYDMILTLSPNEKSTSTAITLRFQDVRQLHVNNLGGQILLLHVEDLTSTQQESIRYRVTELEDQSIDFTCRDMLIENE